MNSAVLRHLVTSLCFVNCAAPSSKELEAAERPRSQVGDTGDALGCSLQIGSGADLTRAIRAYRVLPPCAARGDNQLVRSSDCTNAVFDAFGVRSAWLDTIRRPGSRCKGRDCQTARSERTLRANCTGNPSTCC